MFNYKLKSQLPLTGTTRKNNFVGIGLLFLLLLYFPSQSVLLERVGSVHNSLYAQTTVSFQNGVSPTSSYSGTEDTYIRGGSNSNYGNSSTLRMDGSPDYAALLKWDVSSISPGSNVQSVSITLKIYNSSGDQYEIYELKRAWTESQVNWGHYNTASDLHWQVAGAQGANDRGSTALGSMGGGTGFQTFTLNATGVAVVQSWIDNPSSNNGIIVQDYTQAWDSYRGYSSEKSTKSYRPKLNIEYGGSGGGSYLTFQDGVSPDVNYSGTRDTYMDINVPTTNFGTSSQILIDGSPDYGTLLKWDLSSLQAGTSVATATITLTAFNPTGNTYEVYEIKRDWVETQATWNNFSSGNAWGTAGAQGSQDRSTAILGTITGGTGNRNIDLNAAGKALVQSWIDNPSTNYGIVIQDYPGCTDGMDFYSREHGNANQRPKLALTVSPPFTDFTVSAGLSGKRNKYGAGWGDYNNDGYPDLYITWDNKVYENDGDGTFSQGPVLICGNRAAHWADTDNDGDLDFASTINLHYSINNNNGASFTYTNVSSIGFSQINNLGDLAWLDYDEDGFLDMWAPNGSYPYTYMYKNNGNQTFTGIPGNTIGLSANVNGETTIVGDYNGDGHTDILYRSTTNVWLWKNNGNGTFSEVSSAAGISFSGSGNGGAYNGTAFGDYDNDGDLDLYGAQPGANKLYRNNGNGTFTDVTAAAGVGGLSLDSKGVAWADYDNDGDLDLYVANRNGANQFFLNNGDGTFTDVAPTLGLNDSGRSWATVWADYDIDGDLDLFLGSEQQDSKLFKNNLGGNNYLKVKVQGQGAGGAPSDGTGSQVELWNAAGTSLLAMREMNGGEGLGSHSERIVHFGLASAWGGSSGTYTVKVKFTSGNLIITQNVVPDQQSITIGSATLNNTIEVFEGSLLAEIRFDDCFWDGTTDEVADSSGNANHGTSYGGAFTSSGKVCNAGVFNGSTGYISVSTSPPIGDFSYSVWVKPSSASSSGWHQVISSWYTAWKDAFRMSISNNKVTIGVEDGSGYYVSSTPGSIQDGTWYHIVGIKEGNDLKLYLNGSLINSVGSIPNPFNGSPTDFALGRNPHYSGGEYFAGSIDELLVYDKALSTSEINTIYTNQLAGLNADGTSRTCRECVPPAPLAWWQMDECKWEGTTNEVADSSGNGNHGTIFGDATTSAGNVCQAGIFDGSGDYVQVPTSALLTNVTDVTIEAWIYPKSTPYSMGIAGNMGNNRYQGGFFLITYYGNVQFGFRKESPSGWITSVGTSGLTVNQWHHVVGVYDADTDNMKIYLNGVLRNSKVETSSINTSHSMPFYIGHAPGAHGSGTSAFHGKIDEVRIYDQVLNADQVEYAYNQAHPCSDCISDPIAAWYLDEQSWSGTAGEIIDSSGNNFHGTNNGAVQIASGHIGRGGSFDGVDDYIEVPHDAALNLISDFTLSLWIKPTTVSTQWQGVVTKGLHTGAPFYPRAYSIYLNYDEVYISWYNSGWRSFTTTAANLQAGTWYHVVYVRSSTDEYIYVNAVERASQSVPFPMVGNTENLWIGAMSPGDAFSGILDEIMIYDRPLAAYDVLALYNFTHPVPNYPGSFAFDSFPKNEWVMWGVPVLPNPADATSVVGDDFGGDVPWWRVVRWVTDQEGYAFYQEDGDGEYFLAGVEPPEFAPGLAFWTIQGLKDSVTIDVNGIQMGDNYTLDIYGPPSGSILGKNMMANPYLATMDWSDAKVTDGTTTLSIIDAGTQGWISSQAYVWDYAQSQYRIVTPNASSNADSIRVREGFWLLQLDSTRTLDLKYKKPSGSPKHIQDNNLFVSRYGDEVRPLGRFEQLGLTDWSGILYLHTTDGQYTALDNRFGINPNALDGADGLDAFWFEPAFTPSYGALYFVAPDGSELVHDIRSSDWSEQTWHFRVKDKSVNGSWQLRWPNLAGIPGNVNLSMESPEGTVVVTDLREALSYDFSMNSGSEKDFYLKATVVSDSLGPKADIGFVQNPSVSKFLDMYLFPDEPLDYMFLFVDGTAIATTEADPLYNVWKASLEMLDGGEKEVVALMMDLSLNEVRDTTLYNFALSNGGSALWLEAPGNQVQLSIPGEGLPSGSWIGLGVQKDRPGTHLGQAVSIQPFGLTLPEGTELFLSHVDYNVDLTGVQLVRETAMGKETVLATFDPVSRTIHAQVRKSGRYLLMKSGNSDAGLLPQRTSLLANYPNPFNATTVIPYTLQEPADVALTIYDILGREVIQLVQEKQKAGYYRLRWDGRDRLGRSVSTGVYLVRFKADRVLKTNKLMLLK